MRPDPLKDPLSPALRPSAKPKRLGAGLALLLLTVLGVVTPSLHAEIHLNYQFVRLSLTNSAGDSANKINNRGMITGTLDGADGVSRGYLYFDGGERERGGAAGSSFTEWEGINEAGTLAGYSADPADPKGNTYKAFVRKADGSLQAIGWPGDTNFNFTVDINNAGEVAGGSSTVGWVRKPDDTYVVFNTPGYQTSGAWGLNEAGIAVGVAFNGFFDKANGLIYDTKTDTFQIWNYPGAAQTTLYGINNRGDIVGGYKETVANAEVPFVRWADGSTQVITFAEEPSIRVYGINDTRVIVGRYQDTNKINHSFLAYPSIPVKRYTMTRIDVPGAVHTTANAINTNGVMAGEWYNADYSINKGYLRTADGKFTIIEPDPSYGSMSIFALNNQNDIAGFMESDGYVRYGTNFTILTPSGAGNTYARGLNDAGVVVGDAVGAQGNFAWRYDRTNLTKVEIPGAILSGFESINNRGDLLGYAVYSLVGNAVTNRLSYRFLLQGTNLSTVTFPNATASYFSSITDQGTILGFARQASTGTRNRYFLYEEGKFTEIEFVGEPGWHGIGASGLDNNGQIVGSFQTADGIFHGYIATPEKDLPHFNFQTFDLPGTKDTLLADIDNDGRLVGRYHDLNDLGHGFFQDGTNVLSFNVTGNTATFATGFDSSGRMVGFYRDAANPDVQHGFLRETNGTFVTIDSPGQTTTTYLWRLNDAGQINGYHFEDEPFFIRSFRREADKSFTTNLVFPGSPLGTVTRGMNSAGTLTGWKWDDNLHLQGVIVNGTNFSSVFTVPGWENTLPGDINNSGAIAGTVNNGFETFAGFFRTSDGRTSVFTPPGAASVEVFGLNDAGVIVGEYVDQTGRHHGFIATPVPGIDHGDTDIGIAFEEGAFDLHIHHEVTDTEYAPTEATLVVGTAAEQPIPDTVALSFLGRPGYSTWILPAVENSDLLFLGVAAEEIEKGIFVNDRLTLSLVTVTGRGDVAMYTSDSFGNPVVHFNSADGINANDTIDLVAGSHQHVNWAFNAPGTYRIGLRASGTLVAGNKSVTSEVAYYTVEVPETKLPQPPEPDNTVYLVTDLGTFGGTLFNTAIDVNNQGVVVGGSSLTNNIDHPIFRWENGVLENLGLIGGRTAGAEAISDTGWIVGASTTPAGDSEPYVPYRLGPNGIFEQITLILGAQNGEAHDVNDRGTTVGTLDLPGGRMRAFLSPTNGPTIDLGTFGGDSSGAEGLNNAGIIVGWAHLANGQQRAFRRAGSGSLDPATDDLGTLGGDSSRATAVSETGKVVGRSRDTNAMQRAFLWEQGIGMQDLGSLGGGNVWAFAINTNDQVVGWGTLDPADAFADHTHAWVWNSAHGMRDLNTLVPFGTGLEITAAYGINDRGWIAGGGILLSEGSERPLLLRPATRVGTGDTDIGIAFEDDAFNLHVHHEATDTEYAPDQALLHIAAVAQTTVPSNDSFRFLGPSGAPVWILPQAENPKLLFLGLAAEEITNGVFVADQVNLALVSVEGPGNVAVYTVDGFGVPQVKWNSADGLDNQDAYTLSTGGHQHVNWAFSKPGYYRLGLQASGTLSAGNKAVTSEVAYYHFEVVSPEVELRLTRSDAAKLALTVTTQDGIVYQLQSAGSITGPWSNLGQPFIGTGRDKQFTVPVGGGAAFYRVTRGN